jgi:hypothetical protein
MLGLVGVVVLSLGLLASSKFLLFVAQLPCILLIVVGPANDSSRVIALLRPGAFLIEADENLLSFAFLRFVVPQFNNYAVYLGEFIRPGS